MCSGVSVGGAGTDEICAGLHSLEEQSRIPLPGR